MFGLALVGGLVLVALVLGTVALGTEALGTDVLCANTRPPKEAAATAAAAAAVAVSKVRRFDTWRMRVSPIKLNQTACDAREIRHREAR